MYPYNTNPTANAATITTGMMASAHANAFTKSDYAQEYLKELLDKLDREKYAQQKDASVNSPPDIKQSHYYNNCIVNSSSFYNTPLDAPDIFSASGGGGGELMDPCKKTAILSRFYKVDGTPVKGLWDNEVNTKEIKAYKYEPKPLERRKTPRSFVPDAKKSDDYWEKRRKNNVAARKSREERRKKEIETLKVVDQLRNDNMKLKIYAQKVMTENQNLKYEVDLLKRL